MEEFEGTMSFFIRHVHYALETPCMKASYVCVRCQTGPNLEIREIFT